MFTSSLRWSKMDRFPNIEIGWHAERRVEVDFDELTRRVGHVKGAIDCLSGGLANDTFRIGQHEVLRIYRRDVRSLARERELLSRDWQCFRVPRILDEGEDFLVLEYVTHEPLANTQVQGFAVGRALAEIHEQTFARCGLFGDSIEVEEPWEEFPIAIQRYIDAQVAAAPHFAEKYKRAASWISARQEDLREDCATAALVHGDFKASNLHWANDDRLLVLDWEFAYAGPPLMDIGQLTRWGIPEPFRGGFEEGYARGRSNSLPGSWQTRAARFDLVNLVGLLAKSSKDSRQAMDCLRRLEETVSVLDS